MSTRCPRCDEACGDEARACPRCGAALEIALLQVVDGPVPRTAWYLRPRDYEIGRGVGCDISLPDASISRDHARLRFQGGRFAIEDRGSRNGVHVNGRRVRRATLGGSRAIRLGNVHLDFAITDPEGSTAEADAAVARLGARDAALSAQIALSAQVAMQALDRLQLGVVLLGADGGVVFVNRSARSILEKETAVRLEPGALLLADRAADRQLRQLLPAGDEEAHGGAVLVPRAGKAPLTLLVTPLGSEAGRFGAHAVRAVFLSDPERGVGSSEDLLRSLYGLTPAEARFVVQLLQGHTVEQAASELGVSTHTARSHLRSVFAKTGTSRQSELVRLLLGAAQVRTA